MLASARMAAQTGNLDVLAKGILVVFSCPMPGNKKTDKQLTGEVKNEKHLGKDAGEWKKCIFNPAVYKVMKSVHDAARSWHYEQTLGWPITGLQLLPTMNHEAYCVGMRNWKAACAKADQDFLDKLGELEDWARINHNGSFDPKLYEYDKIKSKFGFSIDFTPIPASDHYAETLKGILGNDAFDVDSMVKDAVQNAERELWDRLIDPLRKITEILSKKDSGEQTRVTDSLLENVMAIAEMVPALNINGNPKLAEFGEMAKAAFQGLTKKDLAESEKARAKAIQSANELLAKMAGCLP